MSQPKNIFDALDSPVWLCSGGRRTSNTLSISKQKPSVVYQNAAAVKSGSFKSCKRAVNHQYGDGTDSSREVDRPRNEILLCLLVPWSHVQDYSKLCACAEMDLFSGGLLLISRFSVPKSKQWTSIDRRCRVHSNRDRSFLITQKSLRAMFRPQSGSAGKSAKIIAVGRWNPSQQEPMLVIFIKTSSRY